jgi:hypothetical protein
MASTRDVWYVVVIGDGEPSSAFPVEMSSESIIAKFIKKVHAENPRKLSQFDASDLQVYENEAAYKNKEPLRSSAVLTGLGRPRPRPRPPRLHMEFQAIVTFFQ